MVGSTTMVDSVVEMGWIADIQNVVVERVWIADIVDMQMVIGIVAGIVVDTVQAAGCHNHILSNLVQVVVNIVVEAKLSMALEGSKDYKVDKHNFAEGIVADLVEAFLVAMVFVVQHNRNLLFLALLPLSLLVTL